MAWCKCVGDRGYPEVNAARDALIRAKLHAGRLWTAVNVELALGHVARNDERRTRVARPSEPRDPDEIWSGYDRYRAAVKLGHEVPGVRYPWLGREDRARLINDRKHDVWWYVDLKLVW